MARLLGLSGEQVDGIRPLFPKERGGKRVDDRKVLRGIIPVIRKGRRWVDAPVADGPHATLDTHPTASSLNKGGVPPPDWWHQGGHEQPAPWGL